MCFLCKMKDQNYFPQCDKWISLCQWVLNYSVPLQCMQIIGGCLWFLHTVSPSLSILSSVICYSKGIFSYKLEPLIMAVTALLKVRSKSDNQVIVDWSTGRATHTVQSTTDSALLLYVSPLRSITWAGALETWSHRHWASRKLWYT